MDGEPDTSGPAARPQLLGGRLAGAAGIGKDMQMSCAVNALSRRET
jgi:hypothetical protein